MSKEVTRDMLERALGQYCARHCPHRDTVHYDGSLCEKACPKWADLSCPYNEMGNYDDCPFLQSMDTCINCQCDEFIRRLQVDGVIR